MRVNLVLLAKGTALNIAADEGSKSGPPEFGGDQLTRFQEAGVASRFVIMAVLENSATKGVVRRDIDAAFISEDTRLDLPVSEPGTEGKRNVLMHGLEGLEDKGVSRGRGFNVVGKGGVNQVDKEGRREEGDIGVVRVIHGEEIRSTGEGVGASKKFSGDMDHLQVEIGKVNEPACLAMVERLGLSEVGEILMVGEDLHREGGTMEIMAPGFQGANDGKEFSVIDVVVSFGGGEGLR